MSREHRTPAYEDDDLMNFGCHVNKRLSDVPASYFHWIWTNRIRPDDEKLHNYIYNNLHALKQDYPDGIWSLNP